MSDFVFGSLVFTLLVFNNRDGLSDIGLADNGFSVIGQSERGAAILGAFSAGIAVTSSMNGFSVTGAVMRDSGLLGTSTSSVASSVLASTSTGVLSPSGPLFSDFCGVS